MNKVKGIVSVFKRFMAPPATGVRLAGLRRVASVAGKVLLLSPFELTRRKRRSLVITIEKGWAQACIIKGTPSRYVAAKKNLFKCLDNQYPSAEELEYFIGMMTEGKSAKGMNIILSVPKEWCVIKTTELPAVVLNNLASAISFEMDNLTPFSAEEVYYDYDIINMDRQTVSVAIYTVRKQMVDPYLNILAGGYRVSTLTLNPLSLVRVCMYGATAGGKGQRKDLMKKDLLILNFMQGKTEFITSEKGVLTSVYAFRPDDINGVLSTIRGRVGDNTLVFINNDPTIDTTQEMVRAMLPIATTSMDELSMPLKDSTTYDLRLPIGAVMGVNQKRKKPVNLLSLGSVVKKKLPIVVSVLLLLLFIPIAIFHMYIPIWQDEAALIELDKQIKVLKPEVEKVETLKKEISAMQDDLTALNNFHGKRRLTLDMLGELTTILPADTWLARLTITDKDIMVEGYAPTASVLLSILENSKYFKDVGTSATTYKDQRLGKERFQIKAAFKKTDE
ncbi:Fimbrial assembly [Candidatus Magnetobacterium bavaricum]|uniref:Fimbrial assembly n=1 Tax=Candidatus Magnetobacterium bavaricum TaxID=29290 RepID=A0A0F3GVD5_9BACT|nr:Fimbrial assembly [Candidatus Magnetobacterium bavaricum]